jgi:hypothetical protein
MTLDLLKIISPLDQPYRAISFLKSIRHLSWQVTTILIGIIALKILAKNGSGLIEKERML